MKLAASVRNAASDALDNLINTTGSGTATLKIYTGTQATNPDTAIGAQVVLVSINLPNPAFGASSSGAIALSGVPLSGVAGNTGTATWFRIWARDGTTGIVDGTVGAGSGDLSLTTTSISSGVTVEVTSLTITTPLGT